MALSDDGPLPLRTQRLVLRRFRPADSEAFGRYRRHPDVARFQSWEADYPDDLVEEFLAEMTSAPFWRAGEWFQVAIELDGELIGDVALKAGDVVELGYSLHPDHHGHGYASEAVAALLAVLPPVEVVAWCDVENVRSQRLLERLGFRRAGAPVDGEYRYRLAISGTATRGP